MIVTQVAAQVRRVLRGHSERALVHAVDADGLEYKIEVPLSAVGALREDQGYVVMISYGIHSVPGLMPPLPEAANPGTSTPAEPSPTTSDSTGAAPVAGASSTGADGADRDADAARVDAQFMALMDRRGEAAASPQVSASAPAVLGDEGASETAVDHTPPSPSPSPLERATDDRIAALLGLRR